MCFADLQYGRHLWQFRKDIISERKERESMIRLLNKEVYKKLGFIETADVQEDGGIQYVPMVYKNLIYRLQDKDDKKAYHFQKRFTTINPLW